MANLNITPVRATIEGWTTQTDTTPQTDTIDCHPLTDATAYDLHPCHPLTQRFRMAHQRTEA